MVRFFSACLFLFVFLAVAQAQTPPKFAVYAGYALINEPNVTLEYRFHPRLAVNLEGAVFVPFTKEQAAGVPLAELGYRINGLGGSIRAGIALYGKRRFGIMHRLMADVTYFSSNLYKERFGVQTVVEDNFYREFVQYAVFYEITFRLFRQKRHHLFVRVGGGVRALHTTIESSHTGWGQPTTEPETYQYRVVGAPVISLGYRFRLLPQKGYFVRDGL